jgi:hypothetical protein
MPFGLLAPKDISIVCLSKRLSMMVIPERRQKLSDFNNGP